VRARDAISEAIDAAGVRGVTKPDECVPAVLPVQCTKTPEEKFRAAISGAHTAGLSIDRINQLVGEVGREIENRGASE
tara:strand:+ start:9217 stop:9450 length:234 start_codon:yes stop_codon:yes gene_type:complete